MKISRNKRLALATALLGLLFAGAGHAAPGDVFYVDKNNPNASDSNNGSESQPWKTIQKAASVLTMGETVYVKAGTYRELYTGAPNTSFAGIKPQNSGTEAYPITFKAYPGHSVIIDQGQTGAGFFIEGKNHITISGFEIMNAKEGGVWTRTSATGIVVKDNDIHHVYGPAGSNVGAVKFDDCYYCTVDKNVLHHVYVGGTIGNQNSAGVHSYDMHHTTVSNNEIYSAYNGVFHKRSAGQKGVVVRNNFIHDIYYGIRYSVGGAGDPAHVDQEVYENVFVGAYNGIYASVWETATVSHGLKVHNNVFHTDQGVVIRGYQGVEIWDNIFLETSPAIVTMASTRSRIDFADNNLYWPAANFLLDQYGSTTTSYGSLPQWQAATHSHLATSPDHHSLVVDPACVDLAALNYRLTAASAARGAGRYGDDIGAYPFSSTDSPPAPPSDFKVE